MKKLEENQLSEAEKSFALALREKQILSQLLYHYLKFLLAKTIKEKHSLSFQRFGK